MPYGRSKSRIYGDDIAFLGTHKCSGRLKLFSISYSKYVSELS